MAAAAVKNTSGIIHDQAGTKQFRVDRMQAEIELSSK
jgi:hypothetical protein